MTLDGGVTSISLCPGGHIFRDNYREENGWGGNQGGERSGKNIAGKRDNGPEADQPSHGIKETRQSKARIV